MGYLMPLNNTGQPSTPDAPAVQYNPYDGVVKGMSNETVAPEPNNPYIPVVAQMHEAQSMQQTKAALVVGQATGTNPTEAAAHAALAKHFATTPQVVEQDPGQYKALLQTEIAHQALQGAPTLQKTLANKPNTGALVQGSVVDAARTEAVMRNWNPSMFQRTRQALDTFFGASARERAQAANEVAAQGAGMSAEQARQAVHGTTGELGQFGGAFTHAFTADIVPNIEGAPVNAGGTAASVAGSLAGFIVSPLAWAKELLAGLEIPSVIATGVSLTKATPFIQDALAQALTGASELGTANIIGSAGNSLNAKSTGDFAEKELASGAQGAGMGSVFGTLSKFIPGANVPAFLTRLLVANAATQGLQGEVPYTNLAHLSSMTPQQRTQTLLNYGMNAFFTLHGDTRPDNNFKANLVKSALAERDAQHLEAVTKLSDNKWRQADPEGWHQFVSEVANEGAIPHLYVKGQVLSDALKNAPADTLAKMPEVARQLPLALESQGDVSVPMADYATHIAGTDLGRVIQPEMKANAHGFTFSQAQEFYQHLDEEFTHAAKDLVTPLAADGVWEDSRKAVAADIARQLAHTGGVTRNAAQAYATYRSHFFATLATEDGTTPQEAYAKYGASVAGEKAPVAQPKPRITGSHIGGQTNFEVAPDPRNIKAKAAWDELAPSVQAEISHSVASQLVPRVAAHVLGADWAKHIELHTQLGGWQNDTNPALGITYDKKVTPDQIHRISAILGHALNQEAMMNTASKELPGGFPADTVTLGTKGLDATGVHALYTQLRGIEGKPGEPAIAGHTTVSDQMHLLVDAEQMDAGKLTAAIKALVGTTHSVAQGKTFASFPEKGSAGYPLGHDAAFAGLSRDIATQALHEALGSSHTAMPVIEGIHFTSKADLAKLSGEYYGTGLKGSERDSVQASTDSRIAHRVHFYVNTGEGIKPEVGVGAHVYRAQLHDMYDTKADLLGFMRHSKGDMRKVETEALDAGYSGVYVPGAQGNQGVAVVLDTPDGVQAQYLGQGKDALAAAQEARIAAPLPEPEARRIGNALRQKVLDDSALPDGAMTGARWATRIKGADKALYAQLDSMGVFKALVPDKSYYKTDIAVLAGDKAEHQAQGNAFNQKVWHASPFKFSRFTLDHIGAGEGSQNYGEGLSFASLKSVAEFYKAEDGYMYSADIPEADQFLNYDKPLSEQPAIMRKLGVDPDKKSLLPNRITPDMTGQQVYRALARGQTNRGVRATPAGASEYLNNLGIPGMRYIEGAHTGDPKHNFVVWTPEAIQHVERFNQTTDAEAHGSYSPAQRVITLFKNANLSTFLHESGHEFLDIYGRVAAKTGAPEKVTADLDSLLQWFGIEGADAESRIAKWNSMSVEEQRPYHEKFARAWEQHLMEGKAPSQALRGVFRKFRRWLLGVYRSVTNLGETPSPEVKGVMDRMLASEKEISDAQHFQNMEPLFTEKPQGVSTESWHRYQGLAQQATDDAVSELQAKSMRDMRWLKGAKSRTLRAVQKDARATRDSVRAQVAAEVAKIPLYAAEEAIRHGEPESDIAPMKLSLPILKETYGDGPEALWRSLPKGKNGFVAQQGEDPRTVAELYGLPDGDALVKGLATMEPREDLIDGRTDTQMLRDHGELASPEAIERAADGAIHNDVRARFIATGLKILTKAPAPVRLLVAGAREAAQNAIDRTRVRDVRPAQYESAEARAAKNALKIVGTDPSGAAVSQRAQLLNHELVKAARQAQDEVAKGVRYFRKFAKPSIRENIGREFMAQIDALLGRFDLRSSITPEQATVERRLSLDNFVEKLGAMGFHPIVPEHMLNELDKKHYKDMEVSDFRGLVDGVKSLEKIGRNAQMVQDGDTQRLVAELAQEAADQVDSLPKRKLDSNRGLTGLHKKWINIGHGARSFMASMIRTEQMADWLDDGNSNGVFNRMMFRKAADAEGARNELNERVAGKVDAYVKDLPKSLLRNTRKTYTVAGVTDTMTGEDQKLTWSEKMALAGVRGDVGAFAKLVKGEGWEPERITSFLDQHMTPEEWTFIRGLASQFEDVYAVKKEMLKGLGDTAPKDVDRIPFATSSGDMPGWYWPITYDPSRSSQVAERRAKDVQSVFEDNYYRTVDTSTGREFTRSEHYAKPMLLSLETVPRVLQDEIRDATTRAPLMDIERFLKHPKVRKTINEALGPEYYEAIRGWVVSMANDRAYSPRELQWWDRLAQGTRTRVTMVGLGFRLSTMALHGMTAAGESVAELGPKGLAKGLLNKRTLAAFSELGPKWVQAGLDSFMRSEQWSANRDFIFAHSDEMRYRPREYERDVRERLKAIEIQLASPTLGWVARAKLAIESRAYSGIAMLDMASALPTWMGGYLKGIEKPERGGLGFTEQDANYYADKMVRNAHGSGGIKDIAAVQRGAEWMKLFTMFYTFWNHNLNRIVDTGRRIKATPRNYRQAVATGEWGKFSGDIGMLLMRTFMYTLGVQAVHAFVHPPKRTDAPPDSWLQAMGKDMALSTMSGIPVLRDIANAVSSGYSYEAAPFVGAVKNSAELYRDIKGTSKNNRFYTHAMNEAGYITGLPLGQPASTSKFLWDVWDGRQNPRDIQQWWHGLSTGHLEN